MTLIYRAAAAERYGGSVGTGTVTVGWGSYTPVVGDYAMVIVTAKTAIDTTLAAPTGWTRIVSQIVEDGSIDLYLGVYTKTLVGSDATFSFVVPTDWDSPFRGCTWLQNVYSYVDSVDVAVVVSSTNVDSATFAPTGLTTVATNAFVIAGATSIEGSGEFFRHMEMSADHGFGQFSTYSSSVGEIGVGHKTIPAASTPTMPTFRDYDWLSTFPYTDSVAAAWAGFSISLKPVPGLQGGFVGLLRELHP